MSEAIEAGTAVEWNNRTYCDAHVPEEARAAAASRRPGMGTGAISPSNRRTTKISARKNSSGAVGTKTPPPSSGRRTAGSTTKRRTASEVESSDEMAQPKSQMPLILGAVVVACVVLGGVLVVANLTSKNNNSSGGTDTVNQAPNPVGGANNPLPNNAGASAAELAQKAREKDKKDIEASIDRLVNSYSEFEDRIKGLSESELKRQANQLFDEAASLAEKVERLGDAVQIDRNKKFDLDQLVDDTARRAVEPYLESLRKLKDDGIAKFDFTGTTLQLQAAYDGEEPDLFPLKFRRAKHALAQITTMIDEVKKEAETYQDLTADEMAGLREIIPISKRADELAAQNDRSEASYNSAMALFRQALEAANRYPAIYARASSQDRIAYKKTQATFDGLMTIMHEHLASDYSRLSRNDQQGVNRWVSKANAVLTYINGGAIHRDLTAKVAELTGNAGNTSTNNGTQSPSHSLADILKLGEDAARRNEYKAGIVALAQMINFGQLNGFRTDEAKNKFARGVRDLDEVVYRLLKDSKPNPSAAEPNPWRAKAMLYISVTLGITDLKAHHDDIKGLHNQFGEPTVNFIAAYNDLFIEIFGAQFDAGDARFSALWDGNFQTILYCHQIVIATQHQQAMQIVNALFTASINNALVRAQNASSQQEARKVDQQLGRAQELVNPNASIAGRMGQARTDAQQKANSLPAAVATD